MRGATTAVLDISDSAGVDTLRSWDSSLPGVELLHCQDLSCLWCVCVQVIGDFFAEDANVVFQIPPENLLEVGLPYLLGPSPKT